MQIQASDPYSCWMSSGTQNLSLQYVDIYHFRDADGNIECPHPCMGSTLASTWENERDSCKRGKISTAACHAVNSRVGHVASCCLNTGTALVAAPACCFAGTVIATGAGCLAGLFAASAPCFSKCATEEAAEQVRQDSKEAKEYALQTLRYCSTWTLGLIGTSVVDTLTLPINGTCPELADRVCFQQERNHWINQKFKNYPCLPTKKWDDERTRIERESLLSPPTHGGLNMERIEQQRMSETC